MIGRRLWPRGLRAAVPPLAALALAGCVSSGLRPYVPEDTLPPPAGQALPGQTLRSGEIIVGAGETLFSIARDRGVPLRGLIDANRLRPPYVIHPGQRLVLPRARHHVVRAEETIYGIARRYGVDMGALVRVNDIPPPYKISRGQLLRLPENGPPEQRVASAAPGPPPPAPQAPGGTVALSRPPAIAPAAPPPDIAPIGPPPRRAGRNFLWPVRGRVILGFGRRSGGLRNDGINIAASEGSPIRAAENGVVAYAGNQLQGFGNLILLKHAEGWMSAYAHLSALLVRRGQVVRRGEVIARLGKTGNVTRPQLHFELRRGERPIDPTQYLIRVARGAGGAFRAASFRAGRRGPG